MPTVWLLAEQSLVVEAKADWGGNVGWPNGDGCCVEDAKVDCPKTKVEAEVEDEDCLLGCVLWFKTV